MKYVSSHVINYQHVSIAFAIIGVAYKSMKNTIICHTEYREPLNATMSQI